MRAYILRCIESGLGCTNFDKVYFRCVIADSDDSAISLVVNSHTSSVEIVSIYDFISMPRSY